MTSRDWAFIFALWMIGATLTATAMLMAAAALGW